MISSKIAKLEFPMYSVDDPTLASFNLIEKASQWW